MISKTTKRFWQSLARLPVATRKKAREAYQLFLHDPRHPSLRFKKIHATDAIYSARIDADYRALAVMDGDDVVWFWIGSHTAYEQILKLL